MKRWPRSLSAVAVGVLLAGGRGGVPELSAEPQLSIAPPLTNRWTPLRVSGATNVAWTLEASEDLLGWKSIATLHALEFWPFWFWTNPTVLNFHCTGQTITSA